MTSELGSDDPVDYAITVDGTAIDCLVKSQIRRIDVIEEIGCLARVSIVVWNWDRETETTDEAVQGTFTVGSALTVGLGYEFDIQTVFEGVIVGAAVRCPAEGKPELEVRATCHGIKLRGSSQFRVWTDKSDFDAVKAICSDVSLQVVGAAGFQHPSLVQHRITDWDFVLARAAAMGFPVYVRSESGKPKLHFEAPKSSGEAAATLTLGKNVLSAEIVRDIASADGDATAMAWDPVAKEAVTVEVAATAATAPQGARPTGSSLLATAELAAPRKRIVSSSAAMGQAELKAWSQALVDRGAADSCYGTVKCAGDPTLRIDSTIEVVGFGSSHDGKHYVTRTEHQVSPGKYTVRLGLGTPPTCTRIVGSGAPHVLPPMDSLVVATVESFEDTDLKQCRVQVRFPWMSAKEAPVWARLLTLNGGGARGLVFVPEPQDEVLVQFLDGDPRHPVVVGSLWNGKDAPPDSYDPKKNDRRAIVSRLGHKVVFDDGEDAPGVLVETAAGQKIDVLDKSGKESITLQDKSGNKVVMNSDGVSITTASAATLDLSAPAGAIKLSAKDITIAADADAEMSGGTGVAAKSPGKAALEGLDIGITGSAQCAVTAPLIKLN